MAFTRKNSFSGGTSGSTITTGNSGGASGDAFNFVFDSANATYSTTNATGSRAPMVAKLTGNPSLSWNLTLSARTAYVRAYVYLTGYPSADLNVIELDQSINIAAYVRITTTGTVCISTAGTVVTGTTTPSAIPLNQWVRLEAQITGATSTTGTCELRVYHNADSTTATFTGTGGGVNFRTSAFDSIYFKGNSSYTYYLDNVAVSDVTWIGTDSVSYEATPTVLLTDWSLPAPVVGTGASAAPGTLGTSWAMPEPELVVADGLTPVNPNPLLTDWSMPTPTVAAFRNVTVTPDALFTSWSIADPAAGVPVNPGDGITGSGQIEWNGFLFDGAVYRPQQLDGWVTDMPGLDSGNVPQPSRHGAYPGRKLAQERIVTLSGLITADPDTIEQAVEDLLAATPVLEDDTELPLAVRLVNTIYVGYGSVTRRSIPLDLIGIGQAKMTLQWTLSDPVLLSRELNSAVIGDGETQTLTNLGNAATYPLIRIPGPAVNPAIEIQRSGGDARVLEFDTTVADGSLLIVDTYYGTALLGGTDVINTLSSTSVPVFDLVLAAGQSAVTYDAGGSAPDITVLWRSAYL